MPLYEYTEVYVLILLLIDIWIVSNSWLMKITAVNILIPLYTCPKYSPNGYNNLYFYHQWRKNENFHQYLVFLVFYILANLTSVWVISHCVFFKNYFDVDHFLKSLCWICYRIVSILCFGFWPQGMRNRSSSTRNQTCVLALEGEVLTTELPGKSHHCGFNMHFSND